MGGRDHAFSVFSAINSTSPLQLYSVSPGNFRSFHTTAPSAGSYLHLPLAAETLAWEKVEPGAIQVAYQAAPPVQALRAAETDHHLGI